MFKIVNLLEITGEEIAQLDDSTLRELIGLLCEADYRLAGLSTRGITWGGHQDARDGGIDVIIQSETPPPQSSFVPRNITGFQVKKADMPRSEILKEMKPEGILREEIKNLIQGKGAYIIVSSTGSTTFRALKDRLNSMKDAVANEDPENNLYLDFFDRGRLATWLRMHPSLILWVRNNIGRPLRGWSPYDNWANTPGGIDEEYLLDDGLRFHDGTKSKYNRLSVINGLNKLRSVLSIPGNSARLAGLSGVGKTRFVQVIFDERIGEQALNRSQVIYTDMSSNPIPDPITFAEQLVFDKTRAILIIDNCPLQLHSQLTKICSKLDSALSLLTIEYDVRDHLPEETSVFRLEPASEKIIEKIIMKRFLHIGQVDAQTIASFSGGNARVAIALANTLQQGETLSGFQDDELFERLFRQRHEETESLLTSAEVCSLVYSFEGTDTNLQGSELNFLASLIDKSGSQLYRDVSRLIERDLVQSRNVWRAVLPHAIANRLAKRALQSIPKDTLVETFLNSGSERLIKSFTRRLSYLHNCNQAIDIAGDWLSNEGWIGKENCNFNSFGMEIFINIAPLLPPKTLEAIENASDGKNGKRFTSRENDQFYDFVQLLRYLAYDPELFSRSVSILCRFAISEKPDENQNSIRDVLKSLFYIYLSGTHASIKDRAGIIENLISSEDENKQELGLYLLSATLETWHFVSSYGFSFGARPRDFGYQPQTYEEVKEWYETFVGICTRLALSGQQVAPKARKLLADNLRGLWTKAGMFEAIESSAKQIHKQQAWNEGWIAMRKIIKYDSKDFNKEILERLYNLEAYLKPNSLLEKARTYALSEKHFTFDLEDDFDKNGDAISGWKRIEEFTRKIGYQVAQDIDTLNTLLPELFSKDNMRLGSFGRGLAEGFDNKKELWQLLYNQIQLIPFEQRQNRVLLGFLSSCAESDPDLYNSILDNIVDDDLLGGLFPIFQTTSTINERGIKRLHEAIGKGKAEIFTFRNLAWGRAHESISDDDLADLLRKLLSKEQGVDVVIEILSMRFYVIKEELLKCSNSLIKISRDAISNYSFSKHIRRENQDYDLAKIARICLESQEGANAAKEVCQNLVKAITDNTVNSFDYPELLNSIALIQPFVFLNIFLGYEGIKDYQLRWMFIDDIGGHENPLNQISDDNLLLWCENDPEDRYPLLVSTIQPFTESSEEKKLVWKSIVYCILEKAPDLELVFQHLAIAVRPTMWSGSVADIMQKRADLFYHLCQHDNEEISGRAKEQYSALQEVINKERESEKYLDRTTNESFE